MMMMTVVRSSQISRYCWPGTATHYRDLQQEAHKRKRTILLTLTGLKLVCFTSLANLHHFLIYVLSFSVKRIFADLFTFISSYGNITLYYFLFFYCAHFFQAHNCGVTQVLVYRSSPYQPPFKQYCTLIHIL